MTLPNFLGVGAARSGTTWLSTRLKHHPQIYIPEQKELHFFDRHYDRGLEWYQKFFPSPDQFAAYKAIGEFTPYYLYGPDIPARIQAHLPDCKLIAILRNPVDRAYSDYGHAVRRGERCTFLEHIERQEYVLGKGFYGKQLERYLEYFPRENILVLIHESVFQNPASALARVATFLSVDASFFEGEKGRDKINASYQPGAPFVISLLWKFRLWFAKRDLDWLLKPVKPLKLSKMLPEIFGDRGPLPKMDPNLGHELLAKYESDIQLLENLLDQDLSIWRN